MKLNCWKDIKVKETHQQFQKWGNSSSNMLQGFKYFWDSTKDVTKDIKWQVPLFRICRGWQWWVERGLPDLQKNKARIFCLLQILPPWPASAHQSGAGTRCTDLGLASLPKPAPSHHWALCQLVFVVVWNKPLKWILVWGCVAGTQGHEGMGASFLDPCYCWDPQLLGGGSWGEAQEHGSQRKSGADLCSLCHGLSAVLSL